MWKEIIIFEIFITIKLDSIIVVYNILILLLFSCQVSNLNVRTHWKIYTNEFYLHFEHSYLHLTTTYSIFSYPPVTCIIHIPIILFKNECIILFSLYRFKNYRMIINKNYINRFLKTHSWIFFCSRKSNIFFIWI